MAVPVRGLDLSHSRFEKPSPWAYIVEVLGPGLHWSKSQAELQRAIQRAERDGQPTAAEHLRIILERRNFVYLDELEPPPAD